jgi:CheY-like chemotaxis protein/HPt (histidine-containing phosphotransfer) domain-containing protein
VGNAIKFTDHGEVAVRATRQSEADDSVIVRCAVTDTGIGIAPEVREKLFQAFSQADGSLTRKYGGTGLGLAISKQFVELMGGHIGMVSAPDKGSTFWFSVQLPKVPAAAGATADEPPPDLLGRRVLIADDNPTVCQMLSDYVAAWKMVGAIATGPQEALAALRRAAADRRPFDVVLLDLEMLGADSLGVAQEIRADPQLAQTRVVMVTSLSLHLDTEAWHRAGIDGHVVKPVRRSRLRECLSAVMRHAAGAGTAATLSGGVAEPTAHAGLRHPIRILVAEDNVVNQRIALRQLKKLGYTADAVANGQEAIDAVQQIPYDLVLMDCHMPELDGYEATRRIRRAETAKSSPDRPPLHIIAMTANALEGDREACLAAGMNDYVSKPVKLPELQAALRRAGAQMPRRNRATPAKPRGAKSGSEPGARGAAESHPTEPVVDPAVFASLRALREAGEPDPAVELIDLFLADTPPRLKAMEAAVREAQPPRLQESAHSLKGTASNLGARRLAAFCAELEAGAKAGDLARAASLLADVTEAYRQVCFVLEQERQKEKTAAPRRNSE